jgi:hypothetical protein
MIFPRDGATVMTKEKIGCTNIGTVLYLTVGGKIALLPEQQASIRYLATSYKIVSRSLHYNE